MDISKIGRQVRVWLQQRSHCRTVIESRRTIRQLASSLDSVFNEITLFANLILFFSGLKMSLWLINAFLYVICQMSTLEYSFINRICGIIQSVCTQYSVMV